MSDLNLHQAVQFVNAWDGINDRHGVITGLPREWGRGTDIYEVTYYVPSSSGLPLVHPFHRTNLRRLVPEANA